MAKAIKFILVDFWKIIRVDAKYISVGYVYVCVKDKVSTCL